MKSQFTVFWLEDNQGMAKVTIEIDDRWLRIVRSPMYWVVWSLQGVALTFAPLFLYWCGKGDYFGGAEWIVAPVCFAMIYLVGWVNWGLGNSVVKALRKE